MKTVVVDGQPYRFDEEDENLRVDSGGEADVYWFSPVQDFLSRYGNRRYVLKLFRTQTSAQQRSARERQQRSWKFPSGFPANVITPLALAYDQTGMIVGYVMAFVANGTPLIEYKDAKFRKKNSVTTETILRIMANLHDVVTAVHAHGRIIGDFNDKNVLVTSDLQVWLIDTESMEEQGGTWECPAFTPPFVDPTIIAADPANPNTIRKTGRYSTLTDWYAFLVMLFQLLVRVHPMTGGFYMPAPGERPAQGVQRIHRRISVFHPRVKLPPNVATPFDSLPPLIVQCFRLVFEQGQRGVPPKQLLTGTAPSAHSHRPPPTAQSTGPASSPLQILAVSLQSGQLRYVHHHRGAYRREDGSVVFATPTHNPRLLVIPAGERTVIASAAPNPSFIAFGTNGQTPPIVPTQARFGRPTVAANNRHVYWLSNNELMRDDNRRGATTIGPIDTNSTSVWAGERFGIALVSAGYFQRVLAFHPERTGFTGSLMLPDFGPVVDAQCAISDNFAWLTLSFQEGGQVINRCYILDYQARLRATAKATKGSRTWLGSMSPAAHATGARLLVPVPGLGIVRIGFGAQRIKSDLTYPGSSALVPNADATVGICVTSQGVLHFSTTRIDQVSPTL